MTSHLEWGPPLNTPHPQGVWCEMEADEEVGLPQPSGDAQPGGPGHRLLLWLRPRKPLLIRVLLRVWPWSGEGPSTDHVPGPLGGPTCLCSTARGAVCSGERMLGGSQESRVPAPAPNSRPAFFVNSRPQSPLPISLLVCGRKEFDPENPEPLGF